MSEVEMELKELRQQIVLLQAELAAVRHPKADNDRLLLATRELGAIVETTATATDNILATAEEIGSTIDALQRQSEDPAVDAAADRVGDLVTRLYTECSFQDLTGQRIQKVVNTLNFLDSRLAAMIGVFGESFEQVPVPENTTQSADAALMNGPQLDKAGGVSQTDIDRLFS
jgi:chemotaxis protein CheZ